MLALPLVHHARHWQGEAVQLFKRPACVSKLWQQRLRCFGDCWLPEEERWASPLELQEWGLPVRLAEEVGNALTSLLSPALLQTMSLHTQVAAGEWVADMDLSAEGLCFDSTVWVQEVSEGTLEGPEFVVDEQSWLLSRFGGDDLEEHMAFP